MRIIFLSAVAALVVLFVQVHLIGQLIVYGQAYDLASAALILISLVIGLGLSRSSTFTHAVEHLLERPGLITVAIFIGLVVGSMLAFGPMPGSTDEQAHFFQSRLFAHGQIIGQYPVDLINRMLLPDYQNYFIRLSADGHATSVYWPGWALLMTPFTWLGMPWMLGPVSAILAAHLIGKFAALWGGVKARGVALLLAGMSGAFLLTGMSSLSAGGHLALNLLFAWLLIRGGWHNALLAGLVGGLALALHNPVPHAAFALPWMIWLLATRRRDLLATLAGYLPGLALFVGWALLQNSIYQPGIGNDIQTSWLARQLSLMSLPSLATLTFRFWEVVSTWAWSAPGLLVLAAVGWRRARHHPGALLLGASLITTVLAYTFYPDPHGQGFGWGARYFHSAWGALPVLAAILLCEPGRERLRQIVLAAGMVSLLLVVPLQMVHPYSIAQKGNQPLAALAAPGADLFFIDFDQVGIPAYLMADNPDLSGRLVLRSEGAASDQALVERRFPGARLLVQTSFGASYDRP